jgi:hypothetical protein
MPDESTDLYAQAFGSFVLNSQPQSLNSNHHRCQEELQVAMDQVARLTREVNGYQVEEKKLKNSTFQNIEKNIYPKFFRIRSSTINKKSNN